MDHDVLVEATGVSKKFCRSLRRSLWYGVTDVAAALWPWSSNGAGTGPDAVTTEQVPLRRDEFWALQDVSFSLRRGECLGLIGHNGAGKSTLLKILNGLIPPDTGRIVVRGRVAALIELNAGFNPILSGRENIFNQAALLGFSRKDTLRKFDTIVDFAEIGDFLDMPVQNYSSGMRVRLGFAVAAQMEPDVLIIDEVLAVGDVAFRFKCLNAIGELMKSAAVIFVSHTMPQIFRICNEVIVLDHGGVTYQGTDIGQGVALYLSLFRNAESQITGSGEVQVTDAWLSSNGNRAGYGETLRMPHGNRLKLHARLSIAPTVDFVSTQFVVWNAEMLPVLDVMTEDLTGCVFRVPPSRQVEISAEVDRLELNGGKYTVSVMASTPDRTRALCRHDNAVYLLVDAAAASGAHVLSSGKWSVEAVP